MSIDTETRRGHDIRDLALIKLRRDGGTQSRVGNHEETVEEYARAMREGIWQWHQGNALVAFCDETGTYWLADGFHRIEAAARAALPTVPCDVRPGSRREAVLYAVGANAQHGLRRTRQDVRRAIETLLRDEEWVQWSDRAISRKVRCDHVTVGAVRKELTTGGEIHHLTERKGDDGKTYSVPAAPAAPHPDPTNAPLTDDELYDLSLLGGFEPTATPDSISPMGTRQITLTDTRNRNGWTPERRTASGWRHALAVLQVEAERKAEQAQKAARAEALIARAKGLGYDMRVLPAGKVVFHKDGMPYGGEPSLDAAEARLDGIERAASQVAQHDRAQAERRERVLATESAPTAKPVNPTRTACKHCGFTVLFTSHYCQSCYYLSEAQKWTAGSEEMRWRLKAAEQATIDIAMTDLLRRARIAEIRSVAEAHQIDLDAPASPAEPTPAPAHPTDPRAVLLRHADELLAGLMQKLTPAELRLLNALAMHSVELGTNDEDVSAELWEHRNYFLHQLDDEELRWIEAGA